MKKISVWTGIDVSLGMVALICLFKSENKFFLFALVGATFLLAGVTYYITQQVFQWIHEKLHEQDKKNMILSETWDLKLTSFMEVCNENNKQLTQSIEKMSKVQEEHISEMREINGEVKCSVIESINSWTKNYENYIDEIQNMEKEKNSFNVGWLIKFSDAEENHRSEMSKRNEEFRITIQAMLTQFSVALKESYERIEKVTTSQDEIIQKYIGENNEQVYRIQETNKNLSDGLSNYLMKQEELIKDNNEKFIQFNVSSQKELSANLEGNLNELKDLLGSFAELLAEFSQDYDEKNRTLINEVAITLEGEYETIISKFNCERKNQTENIKETYENYNKVHSASIGELKKLFIEIANTQEQLLKNMDERQESYRQMNAEDIMIMKEILR